MMKSNGKYFARRTALAAGALVAFSAWTLQAEKIDAPDVWSKNCAACHGRDGKGQTRAGQRAKVKDLTDAAYQKTFTNEEAFKVIKSGQKDGREAKKPFDSKLTDEEIKALIEYVRTFVEGKD